MRGGQDARIMQRALLHPKGNTHVVVRGACVRAQKQIRAVIQDQVVRQVLYNSFEFYRINYTGIKALREGKLVSPLFYPTLNTQKYVDSY